MLASVGPYVVVAHIGSGGMGDVYLAQQEAPIRRQVAVKLIRPGMDSTAILRRFERERRTLAILAHPHIAAVLDAGVTDRGQPYFVMEYVPGEPLVEYCQHRYLDTAARLRLFMQVCAAIEHAHHKSIVHRDLKPANILVTEREGSAICKVIDFGVAKAIAGDLAELTLVTRAGEVFGSPDYMSPEQLEGGADVDTRSDVYSLGAVLYELLTGRRPFAATTSHGASASPHPTPAGAPVRSARGAAPVRPSTHARHLRGDLDWICLTAMEEDRARRYDSPAALATDLQRFLNHEPVGARPPTTWYRVAKLVRRHPVPVLGAAAVVATLVIALLVTAHLTHAASRAAREELRLSRNLRQLSDLQLLREAERAADALWPAVPDRLSALSSWLRNFVAPLAARRERHRQRLAEIVAQPVAAAFARELQWERDTLIELNGKMEQFLDPDPYRGMVSDVRSRVTTAERLRAQARDDAAFVAAWREARAAVASTPPYGEIELEPHPDLWPLGPDPGTRLWEFWHVPSGTRPEPETDPSCPSRWRVTADTGIVLILLPGGRSLIGPRADDTLREVDSPPITVDLAPFFVSKYEITQGQWRRLTGTDPSRHPASGAPHPVENVSWYDAMAALPRFGLSLPTGCQWEYAARGGSESAWWSGHRPADLNGCGNIADRTLHEAGGQRGYVCTLEVEDGFVEQAPVGSFRANGFGLHDTMGNVYEWCRDSYGGYQWMARPGDGLTGDRGLRGDMRTDRGGSWRRPALQARSAELDFFPAGTRVDYLGVRPVRALGAP